MNSEPDFTRLWMLAAEQFALGEYSLHGPDHWQRVERNALMLAGESGADETVVRLFAVLHDSQRHNEMHDPEHGARAAAWATQLRGVEFELDDLRFQQLTEACIFHDKGLTSLDATIGTCWDADRLDLPRVGIWPVERFMSTAGGKGRASNSTKR
jgi:uncharacterized protein